MISDPRRDEAVRLYLEGLTSVEVAKVIGTDKDRVLRWLRLAGVTRKGRVVGRRRASTT